MVTATVAHWPSGLIDPGKSDGKYFSQQPYSEYHGGGREYSFVVDNEPVVAIICKSYSRTPTLCT